MADHAASNAQLVTHCDLESMQEHRPKIGLMFPTGRFEPTLIEIRLGNGAVGLDPAYNISRGAFALLAMASPVSKRSPSSSRTSRHSMP